MADQDYIAARICHKYQLDQLFLWNSLQAIEKYLKAILLYNGKSAKGIFHNLRKSLQQIRSIPDIPFDFPEDVVKFIEYIDEYGVNRYLDYPSVLREKSLFILDRSIWHIRRYCYYMRIEDTANNGLIVSKLKEEINNIHNDKYKKYPHKYKIFGGFIEDLIEKGKPLASHLIWKNFYFGKKKKRTVKNVKLRIAAANPTHFLYPEIVNELDKLVDFPRELRKYFRSIGKITTG